MIKNAHHFENVALLITHYNRSKSLERLLEHFQKVNCSFGQVVISDDGSLPEHLNYINNLKNRFDFELITTPKNKGLGNNINKGQDAVSMPYTLYVQEDFIPLQGCEKPIQDALEILKNEDFDTVRFYSYLDYTHKEPYKKGFSKMIFNHKSSNLDKFPLYSDHPHIRHSDFFKKFGRYSEMKNPEKTEFDMMISYLQHKGKGLLYNDYKSVFEQINTSSEPSTMHAERTTSWRDRDGLLINWAKYIYRYILFNYSLYFKKY